MGQANNQGDRIAGRGQFVALMFLAAAGILVVSIAFTFWMGQIVLDSNRTLAGQRVILQQLDQFLSTLKEAEADQREYLLTGREKYLTPYRQALAEVRSRLDNFRQRVSTGDLEGPSVERLERLVGEKVAELEKTIRLRRDKGQAAALAVVTSDEGRRLTAAIPIEVAGIKKQEEAEYQEAARWAGKATTMRTVTFVLAAFLNLVFLAWVYRRISRNISELQRAREEQESIARFPGENPDPILRVSDQGVLLYANRASEVFREEWNLQAGRPVPEAIASFIDLAVRSGKPQKNDMALGGKIFAFVFVPFAGRDYINVYAHDITDRQRAQEALRESERLLNRTQEIAHLGSWDLDLVHDRLTWSDEAYRIFGLTPREFAATYDAFLAVVHPDDRAAVDEAYSKSLREEQSSYEIEHRVIRRATGEIRWVYEKCEHVRDGTGKVIRSVGMVLDITEYRRAQEELRKARDELELRVRERTAELQVAVEELQRSNDDLERFAYISSHDLQEPLRMVTSYVQLLEMKYKDKLGPEADVYIQYAVEGAQRMSKLIKDLLAYSRVNAQSKVPEPVSAEKTVITVLQNLHLTIAETGARVTYDPLPTVLADQTQLVQVFQNLIGNALKFRKDTEPPRVHISAQRTDGQWLFSVRDNGIGIGPQFFERIFQPFKRLHARRDKYPGSGIGLAIVKRIVELYHGRVCVESKLGEGTTFYFTLPAVEGIK